ncbi:hypothetical protein J5N97_014795 [Dioscorea zingiberensis]|uniref:Uncharacterized protein n=1 Tax=Dioscorea zingiberensis TaxID=325984 RepID=A0A9D5HK19_9LILI|nr:hypothetical protein J5N97_014795 [Dioscorea zingiberensis]
MDGASLIDVSSEDDLLFASPSGGLPVILSPGVPENLEGHNSPITETDNIHKEKNSMKMSELVLQAPEFSASPKQKRIISSKYNLRKSLAWDSEFFTSEGVLNQEELAIVNSTYAKAEIGKLPGILEDTRKSAESSNTFDSDSSELENLEVDLFGDLRASIQKSVGKCDTTSNQVPSSKSGCPGDLDKYQNRFANKGEISSRLKKKPPISGKRDVACKQPAAVSSKSSLPPLRVVAPGSRDPKLKPPVIVSRPRLVPPVVPNKKVSVSERTQMKSDSVKPLPALKKISSDSCKVSYKSMPSKNSTSASVPGTTRASAVTSSYDSLVCNSPAKIGKSPLKTTRRKGDTADNSSALITKTPLRSSKTKIELKNAIKSQENVKSRLRFSSSASPQSSVDSLASDSSSSTSMVLKHSNSVCSPLAGSVSPSFRVPFDIGVNQSPKLRKSPVRPLIRREIPEALPQCQHATKVSSSAAIRVSAESSAGHNSEPKCIKPSGLRLPSPKIGYFDAEKSLAHSSNRKSLNGLRNKSPKNTFGPSILKSPKLSSPRPVTDNATTNACSPPHNVIDPSSLRKNDHSKISDAPREMASAAQNSMSTIFNGDKSEISDLICRETKANDLVAVTSVEKENLFPLDKDNDLQVEELEK